MSTASRPEGLLRALWVGLALTATPPAATAAADAAAVAALQKRCDAKDWAACVELGDHYNYLEYAEDNKAKAFALYRRACDAKFMPGCAMLGLMYELGHGAGKDQRKAVALYQQACDAGDGNGCENLALVYANGRGVPKDLARAVALYRKGCDLESGDACFSLALKYLNGEGVAKDEAQYETLRKRACKLGSALCQMMANEVAINPYLDSCENGNAEACNSIGDAYQFGWHDVQVDYDLAAIYQEQACEGGSAEGCTSLGMLYLNGQGVKKDFNKSLELWHKACAGNAAANARGCHLLAVSYDLGEGVAKDPARARMLYGKACRLGAKKACEVQVAGSDTAPPKPAIAAAVAPAGTGASTTACKVARVQLGVDTVASVERDIRARGGEPSTGGTGPGKFRITAYSGDYRDVGTDAMTVNYDFDAAGPAGRLIAVTLVNSATSGPGFEKLLASRKAAAAEIVGPLRQKSATELVASAAGCQLRLLPDAGTSYIYEVYQLAK